MSREAGPIRSLVNGAVNSIREWHLEMLREQIARAVQDSSPNVDKLVKRRNRLMRQSVENRF